MKRLAAFAVMWGAVLAFGCATSATRPSATEASSECGPDVGGLEALRGVPLVVLGEVHGMTGPPAFTADVVCRLASQSPVLLALEIPRDEQPNLDRFLDSATPDRSALLEGPFWTGAYKDGRSSEARYAMLDAVRRLRRRGAPVRVVAFDVLELELEQGQGKGQGKGLGQQPTGARARPLRRPRPPPAVRRPPRPGPRPRAARQARPRPARRARPMAQPRPPAAAPAGNP